MAHGLCACRKGVPYTNGAAVKVSGGTRSRYANNKTFLPPNAHTRTHVHTPTCAHMCIYCSFVPRVHTGRPCTGHFGITQRFCLHLCSHVHCYDRGEHGISTLHLRIPPRSDMCRFCSHCISHKPTPHPTPKMEGVLGGRLEGQLQPKTEGLNELCGGNAEKPESEAGRQLTSEQWQRTTTTPRSGGCKEVTSGSCRGDVIAARDFS